jgi:hypothetical protein
MTKQTQFVFFFFLFLIFFIGLSDKGLEGGIEMEGGPKRFLHTDP